MNAVKKPAIHFSFIPNGQTPNKQDGFLLTGNGRPLKTPKGAGLLCPTEKLAGHITKQMAEMGLNAPFYKLLSFMLEMDENQIRKDLLDLLEDDLILYQAEGPQDLCQWQQKHWQPILNRAEDLGICPLKVTNGLQPLAQSPSAITGFENILKTLNLGQLAICFMAGKITKSCLISLQFALQEISIKNAHKAAFTDEFYQQNRYDVDAELTKILEASYQSLVELHTFLTAYNAKTN